MNEQLVLIAGEERRPVFCRVASIGQREYYEAQAVDIHPDCKFILADYLEYHDERLWEYNGQMYRVQRTYRTGQELELVVVRASAEEGGIYAGEC